MDDAVYFHERLSGALQKHITFFESFPSYSWILLYFPLLIFGLFGLIYMLWRDSNKNQRKKLLIGVFFLGMAVLLDMVDGYVGKDPTLYFCFSPMCQKAVVHLIRLTEEVLEIFGFGLFAYLVLLANHKDIG